MRVWLTLWVAALACGQALADELDLSFNADAFRVEYARSFTSNALAWDLGWLRDSDEGDVVHGGLQLTGKLSEGANPVTGGLGFRLAYTNGERSRQDGLGVAVGGFFRFAFPRYDRVFVGGHAYIAPSVLSIGELDQYQDFALHLGYNVIRDADLYLGLRFVEGQYDDARDVEFDSGLHLGVALRF